MGELTKRWSNGPHSFFDGKAVALNGGSNGCWQWITCVCGGGDGHVRVLVGGLMGWIE